MTYDYNKPRRLNIVSLLMLLIVLGAGYAGWKFIPVFWQSRKVDQVLDEEKMAAVGFHRLRDELRPAAADAIVAKAVTRIYEMGIEDQPDQPLQVWFDADYAALNARYQVVVRHLLVDKSTVITMDRRVAVPRD
jgi:hypothetical protein